jgi:hypothetical protein
MGLFKQMKDMKKTVEAAPGLINQAQQLGAQAQQMAAAQQAAAVEAQQQALAAQQAGGGAAVAQGGDFEPIAGVSIELYAEISKGLAAYNYDVTKGPEVAATKGVSAENWQQAMDGWNARITANPAVGQRFNALYTGRAS